MTVQTVRKLDGVDGGDNERAVGASLAFRAEIAPMASWKAWEDRHGRFCHETTRFGPLSGGDGRHHLVHAENVERSPQIVDERCQAEVGAHFFQAAHQERALIHPLLDAAERMFDRLATAVENFWPRLQAGRHAVERVLVLETRDGAIVGVRAARA